MLYKILTSVLLYMTFIWTLTANGSDIVCEWLPGCGTADSTWEGTQALGFLWGFIAEAIQYLAVIAVITVILSGIMYMLSGGDEEKTKTAKSWIIYSLVGVVLSISAWGIINLLNNITVEIKDPETYIKNITVWT